MTPNSYCSSIVAIGRYYNSGYMYVCAWYTVCDNIIYYKRNNISHSKSDTWWATRTNYGKELHPFLIRKKNLHANGVHCIITCMRMTH